MTDRPDEYLEPCPFCQSAELAVIGYGLEDDGETPDDRPHTVTCDNCGASSGEISPRAAAIASWNRRPGEDLQKIGRLEIYMWVREDPGFFDPRTGDGEPPSAEFLDGPAPGAFPLYRRRPPGPAKPKYSARDHFLYLCDQSNWGREVGDPDKRYWAGYSDAMEAVQQGVMDFWPELSATPYTDTEEP